MSRQDREISGESVHFRRILCLVKDPRPQGIDSTSPSFTHPQARLTALVLRNHSSTSTPPIAPTLTTRANRDVRHQPARRDGQGLNS